MFIIYKCLFNKYLWHPKKKSHEYDKDSFSQNSNTRHHYYTKVMIRLEIIFTLYAMASQNRKACFACIENMHIYYICLFIYILYMFIYTHTRKKYTSAICK